MHTNVILTNKTHTPHTHNLTIQIQN